MTIEPDEHQKAVGALLIFNKVSQSQFEVFESRLEPHLRQPLRNAFFNVKKNLEFISKTIYDKGLDKCEMSTKEAFNHDFFVVEDFLIKFINE